MQRSLATNSERGGPYPHKHLVTLQQGVSENQFKEMRGAGVILVVPQKLHRSYPDSVQPELLSLEQFIRETKLLCKD